jgi:hypothetical protein
LLGIAAINPDAWIAEQNVARYQETGKVDWLYLQGLSADAVPTLAGLPDNVRDCALVGHVRKDDDWLEWNHGRSEARPFLTDVDTTIDFEIDADYEGSVRCVA